MRLHKKLANTLIAKKRMSVFLFGMACLGLALLLDHPQGAEVFTLGSRDLASSEVPFDVLQRLNSKSLAPVQVAVKEIQRSGFFATDVTLRVYVRINHAEYTQGEVIWNIPDSLQIEDGDEHVYLPENSAFKVLSFDISIRRLSDLQNPEVSVQAKALVRGNEFSNSVVYTLNHEKTLEAHMKRRYEKAQLRKAQEGLHQRDLAQSSDADGPSETEIDSDSDSDSNLRDSKADGQQSKRSQNGPNGRLRFFR